MIEVLQELDSFKFTQIVKGSLSTSFAAQLERKHRSD